MENSEDLAALVADPADCSDTIEAFASKHRGIIIEFDGNIATMNKHAANDTRYDILILAGDYSESSAIGPNFQFQDVGIFELHLTGSNVPDSIGAGINLRIIATVRDFDRATCRFFLKPVSTEVR